MLTVVLLSAGLIILGLIALVILSFVIPHLIYVISPKPLKDWFDDIADMPEFAKHILFFVFTFLAYLIITGSGCGSEQSGVDALKETADEIRVRRR